MSTSTDTTKDALGSENVFYEDKRDELVENFREEFVKAGFSVQDEDIGRVLDKRHKKITRRNKTTPQGRCHHWLSGRYALSNSIWVILEQCLSEDDIELVKQHRLLKKRLRSLCDELVAKRESSALKIQEAASSYHQSVHETMVSPIISLLHLYCTSMWL